MLCYPLLTKKKKKSLELYFQLKNFHMPFLGQVSWKFLPKKTSSRKMNDLVKYSEHMYKMISLGKQFPKSNGMKTKKVWIYFIENDATDSSSSEDEETPIVSNIMCFKNWISIRILLTCALKEYNYTIFGKKFIGNWKSFDSFLIPDKIFSKTNLLMYSLRGRQMKYCCEIIVVTLTLLTGVENKHIRT